MTTTKAHTTASAWRDLPGMLKEAFTDWKEDKAPRLGAALSYYTIFSLAPLLLIAVAIAGLAFGQEAAQGRIVEEIGGVLGKDGAQMIETMVVNARKPREGILATVMGLIALLFGATGAFNELRQAMNTVWEVPERKGGGIKALVKDRLLSFAMVVFIGFLLLVSLVVSAGLSAMGEVMGGFMTEKLHLLQIANHLLSLGVITVLFAMIFKFLPDADPIVAWKDVWIGAFMTAILFTIGKIAIGLYLGRGTVGSAYGAAGSLIVVLVWVYYAAQILFFGAELTQVYASRHGSRATAALTHVGGETSKARRRREAPARQPFDPAKVKPAFERSPAQGAILAAGLLLLGRKKTGK